MDEVDKFNDSREKMNDKMLAQDNLVLKRLFNLYTTTYKEGSLYSRTKDLIGLIASMVLRCNDCIKYHLEKCHNFGYITDQMFEAYSVENVVGGSIVIPHLRRAVEFWKVLENKKNIKRD